MVSDAAISEAVAQLHAAALSPTEWSEAIGALSSLFGGTHAICMEGGRIGDTNPERALGVGIDPTSFATLLSPRAQTLAKPWYRGITPGHAVSSAEFMSDDDILNTDLYHEFIKGVGGFHALVVSCNASDALFQLTICRPRRPGPFDRSETERLQRLLPHLSIIFEMRDRLAQSTAQTLTLTATLDACEDGVVLVDAIGIPIFLNSRAKAMLDGGNDFPIERDEFAGSQSPSVDALSAFFAGRSSRRLSDPPWRGRIPRGSGRLPLLVRAFPLHTAPTLKGVRPPSAVAFLLDPEAPLEIGRDLLSDLFGLTRREAELAVQVAGGSSVPRIAASLGIGIGTTRHHLKQIYSKTGAHDRAALVALVRSVARG